MYVIKDVLFTLCIICLKMVICGKAGSILARMHVVLAQVKGESEKKWIGALTSAI